MNQTIKFPDMRPPKDRRAPTNLPTPEGYRRRVPLFPTSDGSTENRRVERKRLIRWFAAAVALHAALILGWWLTPPLRLKWGPASDAWVQVTSLPTKEAQPPVLDAPVASKLDVPMVSKPDAAKKKTHKPQPAAEPEK